MKDTPTTDREDRLAPEEAFGVLANDTRLAIIEALWQADRTPVSFSELRRASGVDDSAQFNYHLGKLRGQFVRKVEESDTDSGRCGYQLSYAGQAVIQAVVSGTFNEQPEISPFPVEGHCIDCGGALEASYEGDMFNIDCHDCGERHVRYPFPPGGLADRTDDELVRAFDQRLRHFHSLMADAVCPHCGGVVESTLGDDEIALVVDHDVIVHYQCNRCDIRLSTTVGMTVIDHVEIVSFHRDHGVDLNERLIWTLPWVESDEYYTVESTDPWRLSLRIPLDDEQLVLELDGDLSVLDSERVDAPVAATD